jgi:uncharacterized membrane protein SpoIIM required for sporulation
VTEQEFVKAGRGAWSRLSGLVEAARTRGVSALSADDLFALHDGYRRAASDLAYAQTHFPDSPVRAELNALVGAAHGFLYARRARRIGRVWTFYSSEVPRLVREAAGPILLASALLLAATLAGFGAAVSDRALGRSLLPVQYRDAVVERLDSRAQASDIPASLGPLISTQIMLNNIQVSFMAFAGGVLAGTATVYLLITNGLLLGSLSGLFYAAGPFVPFLALIVPHGALELPAIVIAAGAGLLMAEAILNPGERRRGDALKAAADRAVRLLLGTLPLFVLAALIEGLITPAEAPDAAKIALGGAFFMLLLAWLTLGGRGTERG